MGENFWGQPVNAEQMLYLLEHQWKETQYNVAEKQEEGNYLKKFWVPSRTASSPKRVTTFIYIQGILWCPTKSLDVLKWHALW